jgi:hypothetical protein
VGVHAHQQTSLSDPTHPLWIVSEHRPWGWFCRMAFLLVLLWPLCIQEIRVCVFYIQNRCTCQYSIVGKQWSIVSSIKIQFTNTSLGRSLMVGLRLMIEHKQYSVCMPWRNTSWGHCFVDCATLGPGGLFQAQNRTWFMYVLNVNGWYHSNDDMPSSDLCLNWICGYPLCFLCGVDEFWKNVVEQMAPFSSLC